MNNKYIIVKESGIHNKGVFAKIDIPKNTKIIEYIGEKISKEEGTKRDKLSLRLNKKDYSKAGTYIFELNDNYDIDGDILENDAKYINHSCDPNCECRIIKDHIFIYSIKNIKKGKEITFNYGFELNSVNINDYPCKCGSKNCVGYILCKEDWIKLKNL